jgi:threonine/homoserine/homoserine lactone efflux protein
VLLYFTKGLLVGLVIAAPVGPIAMLCITRTLSEGRVAGLSTGLGAATADSLYGAIAGFGLTALATLLEEQGLWLRLGGGVILLLMGGRTLLYPPHERNIGAIHGGLVFEFSSTFILTLANPVTILVSAAIFAGLGHTDGAASLASVGLLVLGVFCGSLAWWLFLVFSSGAVRRWFNPEHMRWVHRIAGAGIALFGGVVLLTAIV